MIMPDGNRRSRNVVAALLCVPLALACSSVVAWIGYIIIVGYLEQEPITFWVALSIAVLIWFIEEMLELTLPCRRALRRLGHVMAKALIEHFNRWTGQPAAVGSPED